MFVFFEHFSSIGRYEASIADFWSGHYAWNQKEMLIKYYPFECTSIRTVIIKQLWKVKKMVMVTLKSQRYFVIYKWASFIMQEIIK